MNYKLPDGQVIELGRIISVSTVRDMGRDPKSIDRSLIGFTIHLRNREIVEVTDYYHFSDWAEVKNRLKQVREDIVSR